MVPEMPETDAAAAAAAVAQPEMECTARHRH